MAARGDPERGFPNREWKTRPQAVDDATLADLLRETAEHHDIFEKAARRASLVGLRTRPI